MYADDHGHLRHDATRRDEWGREMLHYLREHDTFFERLRHEFMSRMDEDYRAFRRERTIGAGNDAASSRAAADPEPAGVAMPLPAAQMDPAAAMLRPDADAPAHQAALRDFHAEHRAPRR